MSDGATHIFAPLTVDRAASRIETSFESDSQVREAMRAAVERVRAYREREAEKATAGRRRGRRM